MTTPPQNSGSTRLYSDEGGGLLRCNDCHRAIYYDYADEDYHHRTNPQVGCFLIAPEPALGPAAGGRT
jgi:hypothetical protein